MLLEEGARERASRFLGLWEGMARHLVQDTFTLIDVLVGSAVAETAHKDATAILNRAGEDKASERMAARAAVWAGPVRRWKEHREKGGAGEEILRRRGSVLVSLLMPGIGVWPRREAYTAGRRLEYTVAAEGVVTWTAALFMVAMLACALVAARWRYFGRGGSSIPILLVPSWRQVARILVLGVAAPVLAFLAVTRWAGWSGHQFSVRFGGHKLIAEFVLLALALTYLPVALTLRAVRRRCTALRIDTARWLCRPLIWPGLAAAALLAGVWLLPPTQDEPVKWAAGLTAAVAGGSFALAGVMAWGQGLFGRPRFGLYYGTFFRSLIPSLALVVLLLSLGFRTWLVRAETRYLLSDRLLYDPDRVGFTVVENDLVDRLRTEMLEASEQLVE
jgi:hypothetical protein